MKKLTILILFSVLCVNVYAQYNFKSLRYDENYRYLSDSTNRSWYETMKYNPLSSSADTYLSLGGEIRYQYFNFKDEEWGDAPDDNDGYLLNRWLFHADLHLGRVRTFVQLQGSNVMSRESEPSPVELNELDLHQAFVDVALIQNDKRSLIVRGGRQELSYGSSRLVSPREGPNNRQAFDGAKLLYKQSNLKGDLFYTNYVMSKQGIFNDDVLNHAVIFTGAYLVVSKVPVIKNIDLYYLYLRKDPSSWSHLEGREERHSIGTRVWANEGRWSYDFEAVIQFGDMAGSSILAWTASSNTNYALGDSKLAPTIGLKTEAISGDSHQNDNRVESFNPIFPRGAYFGYAALIGPSNMFDVHPTFVLPVSNLLEASIDYDIFWRFSTQDGIYNAGARPIYPAGDSSARLIGQQLELTLDWTFSDFVTAGTEIAWFKADEYLKSVGAGKDIIYIGITTTLKF